MIKKKFLKPLSIATVSVLVMVLAACSSNKSSSDMTDSVSSVAESDASENALFGDNVASTNRSGNYISADDIDITREIINTNVGEHAIEADGETAEYSNVKVTKTGDSDSGDEADFYGNNSAIIFSSLSVI